jgi:hypothetical protein
MSVYVTDNAFLVQARQFLKQMAGLQLEDE